MKNDYTEEFKFVHTDNKIYHFATETNDLNGCQMYTFNNWRHCLVGTKGSVKKIVKNIKKTQEIIWEN